MRHTRTGLSTFQPATYRYLPMQVLPTLAACRQWQPLSMTSVQLMKVPGFSLLFFLTLSGCKKETESIQMEPLANYLPLQTGKYITYRTDSMLFTNFGTATIVRSYQEKHVVDALITDNEGRPAYRIFRFVRDTAGTQPWQPSGSFYITPDSVKMEVTENNLRFVKLVAPVRQGNSWQGNRFLPDDPYDAFYLFSNDDNIEAWDYTYTATDETLNLNGTPLNNVVTVQQADESINAPVTQPDAYGYINYAVEKYAKGIGLVYEELTMWEYQPNTGGSGGYKTGFGVKRAMIDHN